MDGRLWSIYWKGDRIIIKRRITCLFLGCVLVLVGRRPIGAQSTPIADHHQHLFDSTLAAWWSSGQPSTNGLIKPIGAKDLIALLDSAGIRRALVLSVAYQYGNPRRQVENEYEHVKAENDWTSRQVARYPDRLRAFCGVNPLKEYALREITRCAKDPILRRGLKLHFGNSDVDVDDPKQLGQLRRVFHAANDNRMAIVVHMHASVDKQRPYGSREARTFLEELLPAAPDVPVQIAHLAGAGAYDDSTDAALGVFADAIAHHDRRTAHLYFDTSVGVDGSVGALSRMPLERRQRIVARMRQIGLDRFLFGCDAAASGNGPKECVSGFRSLPLTDADFEKIFNNLGPYMQ